MSKINLYSSHDIIIETMRELLRLSTPEMLKDLSLFLFMMETEIIATEAKANVGNEVGRLAIKALGELITEAHTKHCKK